MDFFQLWIIRYQNQIYFIHFPHICLISCIDYNAYIEITEHKTWKTNGFLCLDNLSGEENYQPNFMSFDVFVVRH